MTREIKFRLWHHKYGMSEPFPLCWDEIDFHNPKDGGMSCIIYPSDLVETLRMLKLGKIMQFTGLMDKDGKEVYEGDILKSVTLDNKEHFQKVFFEEGAFCIGSRICPAAPSTSLNHHADEGTLIAHEVVGNTYENPKLLEAKR